MGRKGEKDPEKDPEGAKAEWRSAATTYGPIRDKLARACEDGSGKGVSPELLAAIIDARLDLLARKKEALAALPTFARDSAAKTSAAGACLAELIPRLAQGEDCAGILNQVIDGLGDDTANPGAPGIITGCLRAADARVAPAAARAVDKGVVGFHHATDFPDLIEPSSPPRTALEASDPKALIAASAFRGDAKAIEKSAWACRDNKVVEEALARLGSHETEKRLMQSAVGKDKIPNHDASNLLIEVATKGYISELKSFVTGGKDYDRTAYGNLSRTAEKACASSDASVLMRIGDFGRDKGDTGCAGYYMAASRVVGQSDSREHRNAVYSALKTLLNKKPNKDDKLPAESLRTVATRGMPDTNADGVHAETIAMLEKFVVDAKAAKIPQPPPDADLYRLIYTSSKESLQKDQALTKSFFETLSAVSASEKDRFTRFVFRALAKFLGPATEAARGEVEGSRTTINPLRGEAAIIVGRAKDTGAIEALKQVMVTLYDKKRFLPNDAGVPAGLALLDGNEGGAAARKLLELGDNLPLDMKEGCFFALAKSSHGEDAKALNEWARKGDEKIREAVARGVGYAIRCGTATNGAALVDRLRVDPSPAVRAEAAIAAMELGRDPSALLDGALAMDPADRHVVEKTRTTILHLAATGEIGERVPVFIDLCRSWEKLGKDKPKLEARAGMSQGRVREVIRLARASCRK